MPRRSVSQTTIAWMLIACLAGCATMPSDQAARAIAFRDQLARDSRVGIAAARFEPALKFTGVRTQADGAASGAGKGALECGNFLKGSGSGLGAGIPLLLALACMPIAAVVGAVAGASSVPDLTKVSAADDLLKKQMSGAEMQSRLTHGIWHYASRSGVAGVLPLLDQGPSSWGEAHHYAAAPPHVIEAAVTELRAHSPGSVSLPYGFVLTVQARLVRTSDGAVVDRMSFPVATQSYVVDEWLEDGGSRMVGEINRVLGVAAEAIVDEWILLYRGRDAASDEISTDDRKAPRVPGYVLRPVLPEVVLAVPFPLPKSTATERPLVLSWERLPASFDRDLFDGSHSRVRDYVYDVRLHGMASSRSGVRAGGKYMYADYPVLYERFGIRDNTLMLGSEIRECGQYFWTVRARFVLDGRTRTTEWAGAYQMDPSRARRGEWPPYVLTWPNSWYYFPVQTVAAECREKAPAIK